MMGRSFERWVAVCVLCVVGCGQPPTGTDAGQTCASDRDCDDAVFCNGAERCDPSAGDADARGCAAASEARCMPSQSCDEDADACLSECEADPDADGDGHDAIACGGGDCDDADRNRYPGNAEVCDPAHHDEDCDPLTFGFRDSDMDGFPDARCCNVDGETTHCGDDCDDSRSGIHPGLAESCDLFDNDCDGFVDEGVQRTFYPDTDGDGFGDASASAVMGCNPPDATYVENGTDCDDGDRRRNPATSETCDDIDNNCDGRIDEAGTLPFFRDADGDSYGDPGTLVSLLTCDPPEGYVAVGNDCDDADADQHPGAPEPCNRIDDNCSLPGLGAGGVDPAEDADGDEHAATGTTLCTGGPFPADDCDDTNATVYAGAEERCDGLDNDCDGTIDEGATAWCGPSQVCGSGQCEGTAGVAGGLTFACALSGGRVFCWGELALLSSSATAVEVPGLSDIVEIAAGERHACARERSGAVWCWGIAFYGQLGDGTTTDRATPALVPGLSDAVSIRAGRNHTCALRRGRTLVCWGRNALGQLGDGTRTDRSTPTAALLSGVVQHDLGGDHTCARLESGSLACWGNNADGQLGDGTTTDRLVPAPVDMPDRVLEVSAGTKHTCALTVSGRLFCWGSNSGSSTGALGDGTDIDRADPTEIFGFSGAIAQVSIGPEHSCARLVSGEVACWGNPDGGRLGVPWISRPPVLGSKNLVPGLSTATHIDLGSTFGCARRADGSVACWGENARGQLGDGGERVPREVVGLAGARDVVPSREHSCALDSAMAPMCWGHGAAGRLGDGASAGEQRLAPVAVSGLASAEGIAVGRAFSCALAAGVPQCWGSNGQGELGDDSSGHITPGPVRELSGVVQLAAAGSVACARDAGGAVWCWGYFSGSAQRTPVEISGMSGAVDVSAGTGHVCAVIAGGIRCVGQNGSGQLGNGNTLAQSTPVDVVGLRAPASMVAAGASHTCALLTDGTVQCWGWNGAGVLGDGTTTNRLTPVDVLGLSEVAQITAGGSHTCALESSGVIWCWGGNSVGQLGDGTRANRLVPTAVLGVTDATLVRTSGSAEGTCAISASRGALCWGRNDYGQLGVGVLREVVGLP